MGKAGWMASGRPIEGTKASVARAASVAALGVPVCGPDAAIADVRGALGERWELCAVTAAGEPDGVVLGVVRREAIEIDGSTSVEDVLLPDPSTVRPDVEVAEVLRSMEQDGQTHLLVTTNEGRLIGLIRRAQLEPAV